jgi:site-specific DNA recombinase
MMKVAAIYARVSSEQQKEENTIASQTAALVSFAHAEGYSVPDEWIFEDQGYSGASLVRPGLERVRDLAAEGQIQAVLVYSPDRLSRKYAYQVLLTEEFARGGVEVRFVNAPHSATAEDQLLLQFQGMIAEYERAQILERSRRGKLHRARQGQVSVLSGAPFGYLYVKKSDQAAAYYQVIEAEAEVVRLVYDCYTSQGLSIGAITNLLNDRQIATRRTTARWERSTVWAMLRNPAYKGTACFGKTALAPRQRITRPLRQRGGIAARCSANHEQPRADWIEIPVPAIVSETIFALAEERLQANKARSPRRTAEPSVVQSIVSCAKCGYALYRTSTRSSARQIWYYRCLGSDAWRRLGGPVCDNRPIRQDLLDTIVWEEIVRLIENPDLIRAELDRRLEVARHADPTKRRVDTLQRELIRVKKSIDRLVTAYQEDLVSLEDLRERSPSLRQREQAIQNELQSIADQLTDRATYLRLAETLSAFLQRLRLSAQTIDTLDRQKIVRLLVKEILVSDDRIVIRHSIPVAPEPPTSGNPPPTDHSNPPQNGSYLLRSGRALAADRQPYSG